MKFEMERALERGVKMTFTNKRGTSTSTFNGPPMSISHVGIEYLKDRFWNVRDVRHERFIKQKYAELIPQFRKVDA